MIGLAVALGLAAVTLAAQSNDWKIVPGERVGPITRSSTLESLQQQFGSANVRPQSLIVSEEGIEKPAAVIYPDSPARRLAVVWGEGARTGHPALILICYQQDRAGACEWKTREGITLGSELQRLERLNGRKFRIAGFAWDYGGAVRSWNGGQLEPLKSGGVGLQLDPDPATLTQPEAQRNYHQVMGDHEFSSGHPAMQALHPRVSSITFSFVP
jgi:hypothetical protein